MAAQADLLAAIQSRRDWVNQAHIAADLGVSQSTVSRVLSAARLRLVCGSALPIHGPRHGRAVRAKEGGRTVNKAGEGQGDQDAVYSSRSSYADPGKEHRGLSLACREPAARQAEILLCDQGRRHPFNGSRPEWSGYCTVPCGCSCHDRRTN
jgi:hypothetical protein